MIKKSSRKVLYQGRFCFVKQVFKLAFHLKFERGIFELHIEQRFSNHCRRIRIWKSKHTTNTHANHRPESQFLVKTYQMNNLLTMFSRILFLKIQVKSCIIILFFLKYQFHYRIQIVQQQGCDFSRGRAQVLHAITIKFSDAIFRAISVNRLVVKLSYSRILQPLYCTHNLK